MSTPQIGAFVEAISALTAAGLEIKTVGGVPFALVPPGYNVHSLEKWMSERGRPAGFTAARDSASFVQLVKEFKSDTTKVYGRYEPPGFKAVFNAITKLPADADGGTPATIYSGFADHGVEYKCPVSKEWVIWSGSDGKKMTQVDFATFIEDNLPDIASPPGSGMPEPATMLEVSRSIQAHRSVNFGSAIRLSNGEHQLKYEETINGTAQNGLLQIPERFIVGIKALEGGSPYQLTARLRYKIGEGGNGGKLTMWYDLERPHKIMEAAVKDVWQLIEESADVEIINADD